MLQLYFHLTLKYSINDQECSVGYYNKKDRIMLYSFINPLSAGDAFKRIHTVFPQLKFDRN